jgi:hypothetical protein
MTSSESPADGAALLLCEQAVSWPLTSATAWLLGTDSSPQYHVPFFTWCLPHHAQRRTALVACCGRSRPLTPTRLNKSTVGSGGYGVGPGRACEDYRTVRGAWLRTSECGVFLEQVSDMPSREIGTSSVHRRRVCEDGQGATDPASSARTGATAACMYGRLAVGSWSV